MTTFTAAQLTVIMPACEVMMSLVALLEQEKEAMGEQFYLSLDRDRFEGAYATMMSRELGKDISAAEIKRLRSSNHYGHHRIRLNQLWAGWQLAASDLGAVSDAG